jgi:hypothetical protein
MRFTKAVTAMVLLLGTFALAQQVTYDYDKSADFSKYKTYAWSSGTPIKDELNHQRIVEAIDVQLMHKGFRRVEARDNPDVFIAYHVRAEKDLVVNGSSSGFGPYGFGGGRFGSARAHEVTVGTIIIDIVDAQTKATVWRGMAGKDLDPNAKPEKRDKSMTKTAEKLFKNYPPEKKD